MSAGDRRSGSDVEAQRPELDDFLRHLESERQLSQHTVRAYRQDLEELEAFLTDYQGSSTWRWADVDRLALRGFLGWCRREGRSRRTVARKLSAARTFFRFLHRESRIPSNPTRAVRAPRVDRRLPGHLALPDVRAVFEVAERRAEENTLYGTRSLVVLELLYGSGLRLSELHALDLDALDRRNRLVRVVGKGNKERVVPVTEAALRALGRYEPRRAETLAGGGGGGDVDVAEV